MADASSADLLAEINMKRKRWRAWPWVLTAFVAAAAVTANLQQEQQSNLTGSISALLFITVSIVGTWVACRHDLLSKTTVLFYNVEDDANSQYQALHDAFNELAKCDALWRVEAHGKTDDWKHQAGASHLIRRKAIVFGMGEPRGIKTNIAVPSIPLVGQTVYFFPDRLLVLSSSSAGAVSYDGLQVEVTPQRFIESERLASDVKVVGQTWKYVNKSGGPDKRFKDNRQLPVVLYEQIVVSSASGLNAVVQLSRLGAGESFRIAVLGLASKTVVTEPSS
jgi:hypothetical protein